MTRNIEWDQQYNSSSDIDSCNHRKKKDNRHATLCSAWIYYSFLHSINQSIFSYIKSRMKHRQSGQRLKSDRSEIEVERERAACIHAQHDRCFILSINVEEQIEALIENLMDKHEEISLINVEWLLGGFSLLPSQLTWETVCSPRGISSWRSWTRWVINTGSDSRIILPNEQNIVYLPVWDNSLTHRHKFHPKWASLDPDYRRDVVSPRSFVAWCSTNRRDTLEQHWASAEERNEERKSKRRPAHSTVPRSRSWYP